MEIKVNNLTFSYEKGPKILDDISFELKSGEIIALIGRNGSGKTTLLEIISQILETKTGEVLIDDVKIKDEPSEKLNIAYMPDSFNFFPYDSAYSAMKYYKVIYPNFDKDFVIREANCLHLDLKSNIKNLSKGNKAILGLLIALATGAQFILLDEALDGLDVINKSKIMKYILDAQADNKTILLSSHQLEEVEGIADKIIYLTMDGKINVFREEDRDLTKLQIVVKEKLPEDLREIFLIRQQIGRVYTVLCKARDDLDELLNRDDIVLYDELQVKLEDYFFWEDGGVNNE